MYNYFLFDLDGTILETIEDITYAINEALEKNGLFHDYTFKDVTGFIGDGADMLVRRAMKENADDRILFESVKQDYMPLYRKYQNDHAHPFPGLIETLIEMKAKGKKLFVITNKPHELANVIVRSHFGDLFDRVEGHREGSPVKPDPILINGLIKANLIKSEESLFVGDSITDIKTARNAFIPCCLVTWGYGVYNEETLAQANYVIDKPVQLKQIC